MLLKLFLFFVKIGFIAFGGGYAVVPMIEHHISSQGWLTDSEFQNIVALSSMAPGSIATNSATLIGYKLAGVTGAITATIGIILPSLLVVVLLAAFFSKFQSNRWFQTSFYGLRPIITALIVYAAIRLVLHSSLINSLEWPMVASLFICAASLVALIKYKANPLLVIAASAFVGIVLF